MKKLVLAMVVAMFLMGCSTVKQSEFTQHDSHFKNWDHMKFSLWGYRNPSPEDLQKSEEQGWWGIDVPYIPAE